MNNIAILGLYISEAMQDKTGLQYVLTKYGNIIRTRLGLNQDAGTGGIILLELFGDQTEIANFENALKKIEGLEMQRMNFTGK